MFTKSDETRISKESQIIKDRQMTKLLDQVLFDRNSCYVVQDIGKFLKGS